LVLSRRCECRGRRSAGVHALERRGDSLCLLLFFRTKEGMLGSLVGEDLKL
jgi:hypothetical protein